MLQVPSALTKYVVALTGETEIEAPVPTKVPPQLPEYQVQTAPVPNEPPDTDKVVGLPEQTGFIFADAPVGLVDDVLTVIVKEAQVVVLQVPSDLTKYVVVLAGDTVIKAPVPIKVPPQVPEDQVHAAPVPNEPPLTVKVVDCPEQIGFNVVPIELGAVDNELIVKFTSEEQTPKVALTIIVPGEVAVKVELAILPVPVPPTIDQVGVGLLCRPPRTYANAFVPPLQMLAVFVVFVIVVFCLYPRTALVAFQELQVASCTPTPKAPVYVAVQSMDSLFPPKLFMSWSN